jgi:hypothetical protein
MMPLTQWAWDSGKWRHLPVYAHCRDWCIAKWAQSAPLPHEQLSEEIYWGHLNPNYYDSKYCHHRCTAQDGLRNCADSPDNATIWEAKTEQVANRRQGSPLGGHPLTIFVSLNFMRLSPQNNRPALYET